ncbi:GlxA family transcriptional regulator [Nocardia miyunensis]|uniref:GlxA family transcriptional regulator n=1 Tax=Nocardia miyunensis TaxID=282684 RepID=UPI00082D8B42|nr:helix-turn-helix domain-containing protein [Nocardia miyunensis]
MHVAIFVTDGVADFGFTALLEAFGMANSLRRELPVPPDSWDVQVVSLGTTVRSGHGHIVPTVHLDDVDCYPDVMVVPAVNVLDAESLIELVSGPGNHVVLQRIRQAQASGAHLAAACTGTFFLAEAGVLDGSPATTSWWLGPSFRRRYPQVSLQENLTLCYGGQVTTAGAVLSHLDLALSLLAAKSPALADLVARYLAAGNRKTQASFSVPEVVARNNSVTATFERWVRAHLAHQFRISQAAHELGITERSLQRATHAELGMSPKDFIDDIRLERATELLRTTTLTVDTIATRVGYLNAGTLRSLARRRRNMSLAELRSARPTYGK